jgi:Ca-activated chloride channel family protein
MSTTLRAGKELAGYFLIWLVFLFSILAWAQPQWGFQWVEIKRQGLDLIIAIDVSKSMLAQDVQPNRLERAKLAVKDLVKKLKGDRVGLVAFSSTAFLACPLTSDYSGFLLALEDLGPQTISQGGTALAQAIREAVRGYEKIPGLFKAAVLITDGENLEGDPLAAAQEAKRKKIKIFCIGIGTPEGELIRIMKDNGESEFLKDNNGNFVKSRLDEDMLKKIALATEGAYVRSQGAQFGLDHLYETRLATMEKRDLENKNAKQYIDRFQIFLAIALLLLMADSLLTRN